MRDTYAIDEVPLLSIVSNVVRVDPDLVPPQRGSDRQYAFRAGAEHRRRTDDSRTIVLGMHLLGQDRTVGTTTEARQLAYAKAERELLHLLRPADGDQFDLRRTWTDDRGVHSAVARGIAPGGIERERRLGHQAKITVDVHLADPYFWGDPVEVPLTVGVPVEIDNVGDVGTSMIEVEFLGQLANPTITNDTPSPEVWLKVGTAVAAGDSVTLDVDRTTVRRTSDGANIIGTLTHSGSRAWMGLRRGLNNVTLTADSGTGTAVLRYRPAFY